MSVLAIVEPTTLLGQELRQGLDSAPGRWSEIRLLTEDPETVGSLTEVGGAAALVTQLTADALEGVDVVFFCGGQASAEVLERLPAACRAVIVSPAEIPVGARPVVAGIDAEGAAGARVLVSPHPVVVVLAHLLAPLRDLEPEEVVAWLVQPATMRDQAGLEELFDQTRSILSFDGKTPHEVFGSQLAFNLLPTRTAVAGLARQLGEVLGLEAPIALQVVQGGVFHSFTASVFVRCRRDPGLEAVRDALAARPLLRLVDEPERLGPIDAAASGSVLVGAVEPAGSGAGAYWLWGVMDNLTRGGALNALAIVEALSAFSGTDHE